LKEKVEKTTKNITVFQIVGMDQIEQRNVVLSLRPNGLSKKAIDRGLVAVLQENTLAYSSVTRFPREAVLGLNSEEVSSAIIAQR
jgi:hypothetical protein